MNKPKKSELGFSSIEAILLLVVVIAIAGVGYYVYKAKKNTTTTYNTAANASTTTKPTVKKSTTPVSISTTDATQLLTTFYQKYSTVKLATAPSGTLQGIVKQYGTTNLVSYDVPKSGYSYPEDPILCAQNQPTSVSVGSVTSTASAATGTVTEVFGSDTVKVQATVVNQSGTLKIDTITCSPAAVASPSGSN